jgi:6,7-dimethyl-8-ribityllumazine synthase
MPKKFDGQLDARGLRFAIVLSRFNALVGERLLEGALDTLARQGAEDHNITVVRVPGSFEIPTIVEGLARADQVDAIVALGVLIRGETAHFDLIAAQTTRGLLESSRQNHVPVALGVLSCDSLEQAMDRAGGKHGNKGAEAAQAAIEMAQLLAQLRHGKLMPARDE